MVKIKKKDQSFIFHLLILPAKIAFKIFIYTVKILLGVIIAALLIDILYLSFFRSGLSNENKHLKLILLTHNCYACKRGSAPVSNQSISQKNGVIQ